MSRRKKPSVRDMDFISVSDMAEALGTCTATVYRYIHAGIIKAKRPKTPGMRARFQIPRDFALKFLQGSGGQVPVPKPRGRRRKRTKALQEPDPRQLAFRLSLIDGQVRHR